MPKRRRPEPCVLPPRGAGARASTLGAHLSASAAVQGCGLEAREAKVKL